MPGAFAAAARALHRDPNASFEAWYTAAPGRIGVPAGELPVRVTDHSPTERFPVQGRSTIAARRQVTLLLGDLPFPPQAKDGLRIGAETFRIADVLVDAERTQATLTLTAPQG